MWFMVQDQQYNKQILTLYTNYARKIQPGYRQPKPVMPDWCLTKQSIYYAQCCIYSKSKFGLLVLHAGH